MLNFSYLKNVTLSLILAFLVSLLLGRYVFYPSVSIVRPEFQKRVTTSPKLIADTFTKVGKSTISRLREIGSLLLGSRTTATIPPPWTSDKSSKAPRPKGGGRLTLPRIPSDYQSPDSPSQPTTYTPPVSPTGEPATTYIPPTSPPIPTATSPPANGATVPLLPPVDSLSKEEQETANIINQRRKELGLLPLSVNFQLVAAARRHSKDMNSNGFCGHKGSDGSSPWTRALEAGYNGGIIGETVGCGYSSGQAVVNAWWGSPGHKALLTHSNATVIGVGWWKKKQTAVVGY